MSGETQVTTYKLDAEFSELLSDLGSAAAAFEKLKASAARVDDEVKSVVASTNKLSSEQAKAEAAAKQQAKALEALDKITIKAGADTRTASQQIQVAYEGQLKQIAKLEAAGGDAAAAAVARQAVTARAARETAVAEQALAAAALEAAAAEDALAGSEAAESVVEIGTAAEKAAKGVELLIHAGLGREMTRVTMVATGLAEALGPIGTVAGTAAIGIVAIGAAGLVGHEILDKVAESAKAANERLKEQGRESEETTAAIEGWESANREVKDSLDDVAVVLAQELLPAFSDLAPSLASAAESLVPLTEDLGAFLDVARTVKRDTADFTELLLLIVTGGFFEATGIGPFLHDLGEVPHKADAAAAGLNKVADSEGRIQKMLGLTTEKLAEITQEGKEADKATAEGKKQEEDADKRRASAAKERAAADADLSKMLHDDSVALLDDRGKILQSYSDEIDRIAALEKTSGDHATADADRAAALRKELSDLDKLKAKEDKQAADAKKTDDKKDVDADKKKQADLKAGFATLAKESIAGVGDAAEQLQGLFKEGSKAYEGLFLVRQAAAAASTIVNTAEGATAALTIPPPAGEALAAERITFGGIQLASIVAASVSGLKKNHAGSSGVAPDESLRVVLDSEAVLNSQTTAAMGGHAGVARVNARGGRDGGSSVALLQWRNRVMGGPIGEFARQPGSPLYALKHDNRRVGQRARSTRNRLLTTG